MPPSRREHGWISISSLLRGQTCGNSLPLFLGGGISPPSPVFLLSLQSWNREGTQLISDPIIIVWPDLWEDSLPLFLGGGISPPSLSPCFPFIAELEIWVILPPLGTLTFGVWVDRGFCAWSVYCEINHVTQTTIPTETLRNTFFHQTNFQLQNEPHFSEEARQTLWKRNPTKTGHPSICLEIDARLHIINEVLTCSLLFCLTMPPSRREHG
ncbi:hypothetical protein CEXT_208031 [Caerostris extrusa]|uniref:Uncharacterized protein n=1 Tax=Caerostris extrusa TaxID=172846 RepID=A0AAV4MSV8_CAEEX|nr:hypothetical protein CEXT_208031 [Caerostris extrusa]